MAINTQQQPSIDMQPLASTNIARAGYDKPSQTLAVEFVNGGTYYHYGVPEAMWMGLRLARSPGKYYAMNLKGLFNYERVD